MLPAFWDDTHHALKDASEGWVQRTLAPHAEAWEEAGGFPKETYAQAGRSGLFGTTYPGELGGAEGDVFHGLVVAEALVRSGSVGTAMGLGSHVIAVPPILALGTAAQKQRFVPPIIAGEKVACLAITEPGAGSDVAGLRTRAERDGDHYVLNGQKTFITSACVCDLATVAVRTSDDPHGGISLFVVERGTPGFSSGAPLKKMGWWASDTGELFFEDCRVPAENRLGPEGAGFLGIMANFVSERLFIAATCVAIARLALEETEAYVQERTAFGRPIQGFQVVRHRVAEMATREAQARAFVAMVAEHKRRLDADPGGQGAGLGMPMEVAAAMAKNAAVDACSYVCDQAVQLHGGMGYMRECPVERWYRDARLFAIGGGTTEIMRELIAKRR